MIAIIATITAKVFFELDVFFESELWLIWQLATAFIHIHDIYISKVWSTMGQALCKVSQVAMLGSLLRLASDGLYKADKTNGRVALHHCSQPRHALCRRFHQFLPSSKAIFRGFLQISSSTVSLTATYRLDSTHVLSKHLVLLFLVNCRNQSTNERTVNRGLASSR